MATTHKTQKVGRTLTALVVSLVAVSAASLPVESDAREASVSNGCTGPYGWPVKPFDQAHPIRGTFGDPRTVFHGPRSQQTIQTSEGVFSFHQGLDISAPDGSPVYAVSDGRVTRARGGRVTVSCRNGRSFQYWHVEPTVRPGQYAVAGKTIVGRIQRTREHVHLTHVESGQAVNPLGPGRLTPYRDATKPLVTRVTLRRHELGTRLDARQLSGSVFLYAEAVDTPALSVPGRWHGFPVTPAFVTWRIETAAGRVVVPERTARDVRRLVPKNEDFWRTYARGTHQNWPVFDDGKAKGMTGRFVFRLSSRPLDTATLQSGRYVIVVSVEDTAGNRSTNRLELTVEHEPH